MACRAQACDPLIDIAHGGRVDARDRMCGNRLQPLSQPIPFLLGEPSLGIALVGGVGKQQRNDIRRLANRADAAGLGAMAQQADLVDANPQQLIDRLELRRQQLRDSYVESVVSRDKILIHCAGIAT
jgi:hypothetical protein